MELDGLRGVAIVLVVVYHIWVNRVSGGVDVFLFLSGFLITGTLLRSLEHRGRIGFAGFCSRIARRIVPPAVAVLLGVVAATVLFLPQARWRDVLADVAAAAVYLVNWRLAGDAVDYLGSQQAASPVQHYWSLAIQGQFYLLWPALFAVAAVTLRRAGGTARLRPMLAALLGAVFVLSLGWSVHRTAVDQVFTYFDTLARLWELALGGLVWLVLPHLRRPSRAAAPASWVGLLALVTCGLVFTGGDEFPGWAGLWPTGGAALLVATAGHGGRYGADRLLRAAPLRWLGARSYAVYLWHWPVLICYLAVTGHPTATVRGGLLVVSASLALSVATHWLLEQRLPRTGVGQRSTTGGLALAAAAVVTALAVTGGWHGYLWWQQARAAAVDAGAYPGARHLADGGELPDVPYRPDPVSAPDDRAAVYDLGCHQSLRGTEVLRCRFGPEAADRTVALVGGSHSAHWLPALRELAGPESWRIVSMTKSSCRFEAGLPAGGDAEERSCRVWNDGVLAALAELRPDAVFTTATTGQGGRDHTPPGYLGPWRRLAEWGIPVLAVRDVPWHDTDVPECVEAHGPQAPECGVDRAGHGLDRPAAIAADPALPGNVHVLDLTDYVCGPERCPAVVGNVLVYHDAHHLSATYARTLAPYLGATIRAAEPWPPA